MPVDLQTCPACGITLDHDVAACPDCGAPIHPSKPRTTFIVVTVLAVALVIVAIFWISSITAISPNP